MSVEDETELKDLLVQTLSENGTLAKIKAQLRASVFLALEEDINLSRRKPLLNERIKTSLMTSEGQLLFCIVKEFLEYFKLESTMAVFDAESYLGESYKYEGRSKVITDLGLTSVNDDKPLLQHVVQFAQQKPKTLELNLNIDEENTEAIDNNRSSSSDSIKTETSINEVNSEINSVSSVTHSKKSKLNSVSNRSVEDDNQNEYNAILNETFITQPRDSLNDSADSNKNSTYDGQCHNLNVPLNIAQVTMPVSLSDKLDEVMTPVLKDIKISSERVKSPPKCDKFKSKNNINSLSDLPPLTMNKSLSGKILPSLYNKEFREKPNS